MNDVTIAQCDYYNDQYLSIPLIWYRPGSVVVEFKLLFKKKVSDDTAVAPLKKAVQNGTLGPLPVNPESLKIIDRIQDEGNLKPLCSKNSICNSPLVITVGSIDARTGVDENAVAEAAAPDLGITRTMAISEAQEPTIVLAIAMVVAEQLQYRM